MENKEHHPDTNRNTKSNITRDVKEKNYKLINVDGVNCIFVTKKFIWPSMCILNEQEAKSTTIDKWEENKHFVWENYEGQVEQMVISDDMLPALVQRLHHKIGYGGIDKYRPFFNKYTGKYWHQGWW